jgi:SAM-dependent methyltransferase
VPQNQISRPFKQRVKELLLDSSDWLDDICHMRSQVAPRKRLAYQYGDGGFFDVGLHFLQLFLDRCGLGRDHAVLETGCGAGRIAIPLSYYLSDRGSYDGFDIMPEGIDFCRRTVSVRRPNFRFQLADIYSRFYNPTGQQRPHEYVFPHPDKKFDLVYSTSLFTHLKPEAMRQYLYESKRVLKKGGTMLHTIFILDEFALDRVRKGETPFAFQQQQEGWYTTNPTFPEDAIAITEQQVRALIADVGLEAFVEKGTWAGRENGLTGQDAVILRKT